MRDTNNHRSRLRHGGEPALSNLEVALLGLLSIQPMTGYDIRRHYDRALSPFWVVPKSQIYPRLRVLEEKGFVTSSQVFQESKPDKRVYQLSESGHRELTVSLEDDISLVESRHDLLMRTFLGHHLDPSFFQVLLQDYHEHVERRVHELRDIHEKFKRSLKGEHRKSVFFQLLSLEHLIRLTELEADSTATILNAVKEVEDHLGDSRVGTTQLLDVIKEHFA